MADVATARDSAERVTHFPARDVRTPSGAVIALITMDNGLDHKAPTTLGSQGMAELDATLSTLARRAEAGEIAAVAITGKPYFFCVGADLNQLSRMRTREDGEKAVKQGHDVLRRLDELAVPSFAFVNGPALGGGLEVALNCTYRTCSTAAKALAFPETMLGLLPGWGGAYLAPRLIGIIEAVKLIVANPLEQNRMTTPSQARSIGLVDALFDPVDFLEDSIAWAGQVLDGTVTLDRPDPGLDDERTWLGAIAVAKATLDHRTGGVPPAPYRALDLMADARVRTRDEGFAAEDEAIIDLVVSDQLRAAMYSFHLVQGKTTDRSAYPDPALARPITKIGVVGAGLMASQLALLFARRLKVPVVMTDLDADRVAKGVGYAHAEIAKLAAKGRLTADAAARVTGLISGTTDTAAFADAQLVIEAVFEEMEVKKQVFAQVEAVVSADCILATNTSSLSVAQMAADLAHPERVVGVHFFNPVAVMPLVEVIRAEQTDDATLATALGLCRQLRKTAVLAKDTPSFIVNRLLGVIFDQIGQIVDAGTPAQDADRAMAGIMPMAPFELLDLVGPAVALHNARTLNHAFPDRFGVPEGLVRMVDAGHRLFYLPAGKGATTRELDPAVAALLPAPADPVHLSAEQIRTQVLDALAREVGLMLTDGVVANPADLDLAMITGAGFPFWNGGLTPLLDHSGASIRTVGRTLSPLA